VYAKFNTILDIQTEATRPTCLVAQQSFSNTHTRHVVLQSIQRFSEAVCRLQLNSTVTPIRGQLAIVTKPKLRCLLVFFV